jgi:hypothetical protein
VQKEDGPAGRVAVLGNVQVDLSACIDPDEAAGERKRGLDPGRQHRPAS